jgi:hypothetical protein
MTAKNPVYNSIFKNGAKETRTPDPLHAIEEFRGLKHTGSTGLTLN